MSQDHKISQLEKIVGILKQANEKQQGDIPMLNKKIQECSFSIQQSKSHDSEFESYTGFYLRLWYISGILQLSLSGV